MPSQSLNPSPSPCSGVKKRQRISTLLLVIQISISSLVMMGLFLMILRMTDIQTELHQLRDTLLPRLVKLSQLSQESSASISIAPALSTNPTRFEFETLLSRIKDKEGSQKTLIKELGELIDDENSERLLIKNSDLLVENLQNLTDVVRQQIGVRKRLERHIEALHRMARSLSKTKEHHKHSSRIVELTNTNIFRVLNILLDPNRARFSRSKRELAAGIEELNQLAWNDESLKPESAENPMQTVEEFKQYWAAKKDRVYEDKGDQLTNEFKIKALVEENSLIANRLLSSAKTEFWRANKELTSQIQQVVTTARVTMTIMGIVVIAFVAGSFFVWFVMRRRIFRRLDHMRNALRAYAENRDRSLADPLPDEIGEISSTLIDYMEVIDQSEFDLTEKNEAMEQLSSKLAKYLSPQVYDSIFSGKQEVKVASTRKKLTVFFSDIVDFTETTDRLESEALTQLLNHYLTEMSGIALAHGATIDKYVGDAILIFFGDPETKGVSEDALACVKMAVAMRDRLRDLETLWRQSGIESPILCRMGIHTGHCTVGNFGSEDRMDYTIIGGAVNTASRLETLAEPGQILISSETFAHVKDEFHCEKHGEEKVKGIAYPVVTYLVNNSYENLRPHRNRFLEEHHGMKVDLNIDAMNSDDQHHAVDVLRRAQKWLEDNND
jgi:class 3 adenylate cyclase/HAMP domain-containing protein